jgi:hypothetical protein
MILALIGHDRRQTAVTSIKIPPSFGDPWTD